MSSIPLSKDSIAQLKKVLMFEFPDVKSSHLSEAIAASLRRRTYASLLAEVEASANDPAIECLDEDLLDQRLQEFGYASDPGFNFELSDIPSAISTFDVDFWGEYKTTRELAWRNLMVLTINEGIRLKLFSLRSDDNRWPGALSANQNDRGEGHIFDYVLPNSLPVRAYVYDIGYGELAIHAAACPKGNWVKASNSGLAAGDAFARGWLERNKGAWLQSATTLFNCKKSLLNDLSTLNAKPIGYGDKGRVF